MRAAIMILLLAGCDQLFKINEYTQHDAAGVSPGDVRRDAGTSLVAHYTMDALVGGMTVDDAGGHDGRCDASQLGCPSIIAGQIGNALAFNGTTDRIDVAGGGNLETTTALTVMAWLRPRSAPVNQYGCPYNKALATNADSWQLCVTGSLTLDFITTGETAGDELFTNDALVLDQWTHVAIRFDGTTKAVAISGAIVAGHPAPAPIYDGSSVSLGADLDGVDLNAGFAGDVDDVRIYNVALSSGEIAAIAAL